MSTDIFPLLGKVLLTSFLVIGLSEIAQRYTHLASFMASMPVTTILTALILYWSTGDALKVADFTTGVHVLIYPSLVFFVAFPYLLRQNMTFFPALLISVLIMVTAYLVFAGIVRFFNIRF